MTNLTLYRIVTTNHYPNGEKFKLYSSWYDEQPERLLENEKIEKISFNIERILCASTSERNKKALATNNNNYYEITYPLDARDLKYRFEKVKAIE